jgi:hypothetical protein
MSVFPEIDDYHFTELMVVLRHSGKSARDSAQR